MVPVRSSWTTTTLSTSCCCLHGGHRLLGIIPMPGSSPTLLLAPTSRPSPLNSPRAASPSAAAGHRPTRRYRDQRAGRRSWLGGGLAGRQPAAGGPTTDDGFKPRRPLWEAGGACGASCARCCCCCRSRDGKWASDVLPNPSFPHLPVETLAGPLTEAIKAVKAFGRPLVQPQIAPLRSLVVCEAPGDRGSR